MRPAIHLHHTHPCRFGLVPKLDTGFGAKHLIVHTQSLPFPVPAKKWIKKVDVFFVISYTLSILC